MKVSIEFAKAINDLIPDALKEKIKAAKVKFSAAPPAPTAPPAPPAPYSVNITGGQPMYVNTSDDGIMDIDQGDAVFSDPALTVPYPDGTYTADDGSSITVQGGVVTTYTAGIAQTALPAANFKAQFAAQEVKFTSILKAELKLRDDKITELEAVNKDLTDINKTVVEFMNKVLETPVIEKKKPAEKVDFSKMTQLEIYRYHKAAEKNG